MTQTIYNLHTDGDHWRITKFVDGNPESSYLTSHSECQCPAGNRPTCRHRQMLPVMLSAGLANQPWFLDWDNSRQVVDFQGNAIPKQVLAQAKEGSEAEPAIDLATSLRNANIPGVTIVSLDDPATLYNTIAEALGEPPQPATRPVAWRRI